MANYYGAAIVLDSPKSHNVKPNVEGSVRFDTICILAVLWNERFFSFEETRRIVIRKLGGLNHKPFQKRTGAVILLLWKKKGIHASAYQLTPLSLAYGQCEVPESRSPTD